MTRKTADLNSSIRQFIVEHFPLARKQSSFGDDSSLLKSGIIDSMGVHDLLIYLEEEFRITIHDEDLQPENFETIATTVAFVESKNNSQKTP
jgi:acyl carrier protein